jgi:phosphatidylserine/phosphatidylglycerophosphate/cardiolipin synthase-like enzyme
VGINHRIYSWWGVVFFAIGVLAAIGTTVTLFFSLGRRPAEIWVTERPPVTSEAFLLALSGAVNSPAREGGRAELLSNGVEILPALLEAANGAEKSINWMVYIWEPGRMSEVLFKVLVRQARAGVEVRVMLDGFGGKNAPARAWVRTVRGAALNKNPASVAVRFVAAAVRGSVRRNVFCSGGAGIRGYSLGPPSAKPYLYFNT